MNIKRQLLNISNVIKQTQEVMAQNDKIAGHLAQTMEMACENKRKGKGK